MKGYTPIIAHPERNLEVMRHLDPLYELVEAGALAQLTFGSFEGRVSKKVKKLSEQLIDTNLVHFIATDAHLYKGGRWTFSRLFGNFKRKKEKIEPIICFKMPNSF
ncbi:Tyrosine-protein phosphatase YwqE [Listeria fleischmannii subsp. fleischmannii]|uniref:protein-tyrosine-phosphatase n=1 Tax=Listeria fleischmannii subsp. fleischmannii TaxID=1671902 RepID=A0A2X3IQA0_9LIST|nr:CpsB/CapC family capsule biosynthesis tyrosine phosphatase [Listeria fleischmannii]SQC63109.1 Tyrosine-protein phosphatase YwqE [Listeria fleischmannii subsp. fleischmannii]